MVVTTKGSIILWRIDDQDGWEGRPGYIKSEQKNSFVCLLSGTSRAPLSLLTSDVARPAGSLMVRRGAQG